MEETITHPRRARRRRRRSLLPLAILLAALAIAVPVILSLLPRQPRVESEPEDPMRVRSMSMTAPTWSG